MVHASALVGVEAFPDSELVRSPVGWARAEVLPQGIPQNFYSPRNPRLDFLLVGFVKFRPSHRQNLSRVMIPNFCRVECG